MSWSKYSKQYRKEWEDLPECKNWLSGEGDRAHCKVCKTDLRPQLADLKKHAQGKKHLSFVQAKRFQSSISAFKPIEDLPVNKKRRLELRVALQTAVCTSFRSLDSLGSILEQELGRGAFQMHRTKCMALVKKILSPHFKEELRKDIQDVPFSLLIDESTDVSVSKLLGVSIRYFSKAINKIVSTFLSLIEVEQADALSLEGEIRYNEIKTNIMYFLENKQNNLNCESIPYKIKIHSQTKGSLNWTKFIFQISIFKIMFQKNNLTIFKHFFKQ